ncbi:MAG: TRL-like family protein [Bacteroidales bacterium]|nr:TRL-like family protein [Bacteroidales bacterium]
MRIIKNFMFVAAISLLLSSCAVSKSPLTGFLYMDVKAPLTATGNSGSSKVGSASAKSILGIVATGDASIDAAAKSAGITKIHHVDEQSTSILGIIATYKVYVYGE